MPSIAMPVGSGFHPATGSGDLGFGAPPQNAPKIFAKAGDELADELARQQYDRDTQYLRTLGRQLSNLLIDRDMFEFL